MHTDCFCVKRVRSKKAYNSKGCMKHIYTDVQPNPEIYFIFDEGQSLDPHSWTYDVVKFGMSHY